MATVFVELVSMILGAVLAPLWVVIVLLMLASPRGVAKGAAFVLGMTTTRLIQGLLFGVLFYTSAEAQGEEGSSAVVGALLLVVGILLLVAALRKWRKEDDPDEPPPKWMQSLEALSPLRAFGLGAMLVAIGPKLWVFTLSALAVIASAQLGLVIGTITYLGYVVLAQIVLIVAVLLVAVAPQASQAMLQQAIAWLNKYNRPISIVVALIFGVLFTIDGATKLLS